MTTLVLASGAAAVGLSGDAPNAPTGLSGDATDNGEVTLTWSASGATSFRVERSANGGGSWSTAGTPQRSPFVDTGLAANTTYDYRVVAINFWGESSASSSIQVTTIDTDLLQSQFFAPYVTHLTETYAETANASPFINLRFTGTSLSIAFDVSPSVNAGFAAGSYPYIAYRVDGGAATRVQLTSATTSIAVATGLSDTTHTFELWADAMGSTDRWTTPGSLVRVTGCTLDSGRTLLAPVAKTYKAIAFGDSITEAWSSEADGSRAIRRCYATLLGDSLDADIGVIGCASQSYGTAGTGDVPELSTAYEFYYSGVSRLDDGVLFPDCDLAFDCTGTNGASAAAIESFIGVLRTIAPNAKIFQLVPPGQFQAGAKATAVADYLADHPGDTEVYCIDTGIDYLDTEEYQGAGGSDTLHPSAAGHQAYHDDMLPLIEAEL